MILYWLYFIAVYTADQTLMLTKAVKLRDGSLISDRTKVVAQRAKPRKSVIITRLQLAKTHKPQYSKLEMYVPEKAEKPKNIHDLIDNNSRKIIIVLVSIVAVMFIALVCCCVCCAATLCNPRRKRRYSKQKRHSVVVYEQNSSSCNAREE